MDETELKEKQKRIKKAMQEWRSASASYRNALTQFNAQMYVGNHPSQRLWLDLMTTFVNMQIANVRYQLLGRDVQPEK